MERLLKILIADNEEVIHQTIAAYLRDSGHTVDRVHNSSAALTAMENYDYDLALVDIRTPGMDGLSLLNSIQETCPDMPVVVVAEYEDMDVVLQALRLGSVDFLTKPVKLLELDAVLEKSIRFHTPVNQYKHDIEAPQTDHRGLQKLKEVKHHRLLSLLVAGCLLVLLFLAYGVFTDTEESARPVAIEEIQAEIARLRLVESALRESERLHQLLSENVTDVIWTTDMDMRSTYMNPAITRITGYKVDEAMAMSWEELWHPECLALIKRIFIEELAGKGIDHKDVNGMRTARVRLICSDGSATWVEVKCSSLGDPGERPVGLLVILREVAEDGQVARF